jgi:hypothetical protein
MVMGFKLLWTYMHKLQAAAPAAVVTAAQVRRCHQPSGLYSTRTEVASGYLLSVMLHMSASMSGKLAPMHAMLLQHLHHAASIAGL